MRSKRRWRSFHRWRGWTGKRARGGTWNRHNKKLYIAVNHDVPDRQTLPTRFLPPEAPDAGQAGDPTWKRLLKSLPFF